MSDQTPGAPAPLSAIGRHKALERLWGTAPGWGALSAVNHSTVGLRFIITSFVFFLIGGVLAMLIRAQLAGPETDFLDAAAYAQVFTMHGTVMMFLFAIPAIEGLALYMLPKLLGARDLAFPRLSAFGYWCYLFGGSILILAMLGGVAPDSGWFMYTPLSSKPYSPGINSDVWLIGVTFVEVSAVCAAVEFMTTVLKIRTGGMALHRMPIMVWYLWVTAAMMLFGFPPLILGSVLLELERAFDWPFFDPTRGGSPLLWQHLFWLFGHPEVYIIFLPGAGIISTILPVFTGQKLVGYAWIIVALIALGFISFGIWAHHMFATGIPHLSLAFFSAASTLVVIPTAVQIFAWLATLLSGRPRITLSMLYFYGFLSTFVIGGLTGVMVAVVPFDWQAHDTHFIVAHLHYVLMGGFVFPVLAGIYYWLPHFTGRKHLEGLGRTAFALIMIGFNAAFLPMHLTGLWGMPRRVFTYGGEMGWDLLNLISSVAGFILAIGFALVVVDVVQVARFGRRSRRNPWGASTLEWGMPTPPPAYNIGSQPHVTSRDPLEDDPGLPAALARGEGYLGQPRNGWRETLSVHMLSGEPDQVVLLPGPTLMPLWTALATGLFFVSFLFKLYPLSAIAFVLIVICGWRWMWASGLREDVAPVDIGRGQTAPLHAMAADPPTLWGMVFTLMANGVFFGALVFGYLFLWVVAPNWPPPALLAREPVTPLLVLAGLATGLAAVWRGARANGESRAADSQTWLLVSAAAGAVIAGGALAVPLFTAPAPNSHAYAAAVTFISGYLAFHGLIAAILSAYAWARSRHGWISRQRAVEFSALRLWWLYLGATGLISLALLHGPAWMS
ncbi:MAG: cytochrome c oxidase subunit I [Phenylobacterium sp.]|nr:cytochrome c oxidase subunit I [Phenylobacterium sp.]